jgi:hypothetical protein
VVESVGNPAHGAGDKGAGLKNSRRRQEQANRRLQSDARDLRGAFCNHITEIAPASQASYGLFTEAQMSKETQTYTDEQNRAFAYRLAETYQRDPDYFLKWEAQITEQGGEIEAWKSLNYGVALLESYWHESPEIRRLYGHFTERETRLQEKFDRQIDPFMWSRYPRHGYIYIVESAGFYKIGRAKQLDRRVWEFKTEYPLPVYLIWACWVADAVADEQRLHHQFADKRVRGEWFNFSTEDLIAAQEASING